MAVKQDILDIYAKEVEGIKEAGLFKGEAPIASPQGARVKLEDGREVINMCANNYLGLGDDKRLIEAAKKTITVMPTPAVSLLRRRHSRRTTPSSSVTCMPETATIWEMPASDMAVCRA